MKILILQFVLTTVLIGLLVTDGYCDITPGWESVSTILNKIVPPTFKNKDYNITSYGALGDGITDCTEAFAEAITACSSAGGGRVVVPAGNFLTGPIELKDNVNLYLSSGATIKFNTDPSKYLPVVLVSWEGSLCYNYKPLLYARDAKNIAITGSGTIDGQATSKNWQSWRPKQDPDKTNLRSQNHNKVPVEQRIFGEGHFLRPGMIEFYNCQNILLDGVTAMNSPFWTIHPIFCKNITAQNLTIIGHYLNTDGFDPESCSYVLARKLNIDVGDDSIAIKAGRDNDGWSYYTTCENIIIQDCALKAKVGGVAIGSEMSAGVRNVYAENCTLSKPKDGLQYGIYLKSNPDRGGFITDFYARNIKVDKVKSAICLTGQYTNYADKNYTEMRNINIEKLTCTKATEQGISIMGADVSKPIDTVTLKDITINKSPTSLTEENVVNLTLKNVAVNGTPLESK